MWLDIEALPVHGDAYDVFMALPPHTSSRQKTTNRWMYQKEVSMRVNLFPRSPLAARIFIVLMLLLLLAGLYLGGRTVGGFSSLVFPFYQQLTVPDDVAVLTFHNDNQRTGQNLNETLLNTPHVNHQHFGKRVSYPCDGQVDAKPHVLPH